MNVMPAWVNHRNQPVLGVVLVTELPSVRIYDRRDVASVGVVLQIQGPARSVRDRRDCTSIVLKIVEGCCVSFLSSTRCHKTGRIPIQELRTILVGLHEDCFGVLSFISIHGSKDIEFRSSIEKVYPEKWVRKEFQYV